MTIVFLGKQPAFVWRNNGNAISLVAFSERFSIIKIIIGIVIWLLFDGNDIFKPFRLPSAHLLSLCLLWRHSLSIWRLLSQSITRILIVSYNWRDRVPLPLFWLKHCTMPTKSASKNVAICFAYFGQFEPQNEYVFFGLSIAKVLCICLSLSLPLCTNNI